MGHSPVHRPSPSILDGTPTMDFPDAIRALIGGERIARLSWDSKDYGQMRDGWLMILRYKDNRATWHQWLVNDGDMLAEDWVILD